GVRPLFGAADDLDGEAIRLDLEAPEVGEFAAFLLGKDGTVNLQHHQVTLIEGRAVGEQLILLPGSTGIIPVGENNED
ncbi:hypothetical protein AB9E29_33735, partial [Rhizobium leguminosarum]